MVYRMVRSFVRLNRRLVGNCEIVIRNVEMNFSVEIKFPRNSTKL